MFNLKELWQKCCFLARRRSIKTTVKKRVGTFLHIHTVDGVFTGKMERVWDGHVYMNIGDRVYILPLKDIKAVEPKEKHPLLW